MAHRRLVSVQQIVTGTGAGALTSGAATSAKFRRAQDAGVVDGDSFDARIQHATIDAEWEVVKVTYTGGAFVPSWESGISASATGSLISFTTGNKIMTPTFTDRRTVDHALEAYLAPAIAAGTLTLDLSLGTVFNVALTANVTTLAFSNVPAGYAVGITIEVTANGTPYTWATPASVVALNGTYTPSSTNAKRDLLSLVTLDGGTTWRQTIIAQNY